MLTTIKLILLAIVAGLKAFFGNAEDRKGKELDKKKARLKVLNAEILDVMGDLNDAINTEDNVAVNQLSSALDGLRKERNDLQADIPS